MKRILSALLSLLLLSAILLFPASSEEAATRTVSKPLSTQELTAVSTLPDMTRDIANGLDSSAWSSNHASGSAWNTNLLSGSQLADIANHKRYGISAIGVSALERPIKAAVDGVWANGNVGMALSTGRKEKGAMAWLPDGKYYNAAGIAGENPDEGYVYRLILTLNFGKIANLEQFGYIATAVNNLLQAADLYVSDDGETWTPVGYYDQCAKRAANESYPFSPGKDLGADAKPGEKNGGIMDDNGRVLTFNLPAGTKGQFLRIAATALSGVKDDKLPDAPVYEDYSVDNSVTNNFREVFVIGSLTEETGAEITTDTEDNENTTEAPVIIVKPPKKTEEETQTQETPSAPVGSEEENPSAGNTTGCASGIGTESYAVLLLAIGIPLAVTVANRRKKK